MGIGDGKEEILCGYQISEDTKYNEKRYHIFEAQLYSFHGLDSNLRRKNKEIKLTHILNLGHRKNGPFLEEWVNGPMTKEAELREDTCLRKVLRCLLSSGQEEIRKKSLSEKLRTEV